MEENGPRKVEREVAESWLGSDTKHVPRSYFTVLGGSLQGLWGATHFLSLFLCYPMSTVEWGLMAWACNSDYLGGRGDRKTYLEDSMCS